jgi:transposase
LVACTQNGQFLGLCELVGLLEAFRLGPQIFSNPAVSVSPALQGTLTDVHQLCDFVSSRSTLTNLVKRAIDLLRPIVDAQTDNVLRSRVLAMDETPIKAGHQGRAGPQKGKMKTGWFWPLYGDDDEVVFTYSNSRGRLHIEQVLNDQFSGTLISDGYAAYARYAAAQKGITHAQCWVHSRRCFVEAQKDHPEKATEALQQIAKLYQIEDTIKEKELTGEKKRQYRLDHAKPVVSGFFQWCRDQLAQGGLLPSEPLTKALNYVLSRETSLTVFLEDPDVQPDTNHLERALRPIPMGKNYAQPSIMCSCAVGHH